MRVNWSKGVVLTVAALAAAAVFVAPVMAQGAQNQAVGGGAATAGIPLSVIQSWAGGGGMSAGSMSIGGGNMSATTMGNNRGQTDTCLKCGECLFLDSYNPNNTYDTQTGTGNPILNTVTTSAALTAGEPYLITISGTVSYWAKSGWSPRPSATLSLSRCSLARPFQPRRRVK